MVAVAQLVRAPVCGTGGCGFNSRQPTLQDSGGLRCCVFRSAQSAVRSPSSRSVAQLVEHRSPKPGVAGSIPAGPVVESFAGSVGEKRKVFVAAALSSRGLGRGPLKAQTRVRIPLALLFKCGLRTADCG